MTDGVRYCIVDVVKTLFTPNCTRRWSRVLADGTRGRQSAVCCSTSIYFPQPGSVVRKEESRLLIMLFPELNSHLHVHSMKSKRIELWWLGTLTAAFKQAFN